jgi:CheY-like chemotaxis protein
MLIQASSTEPEWAPNHPDQSGAREEGSVEDARPTVLLVDDDFLIQESVGIMLGYLGFHPIIAATGEEAMTRLLEGLQPLLVILDMDMPGMGGASTLRWIRVERPVLPILIATGRVTKEVQELVETHLAVALMPKPYGLNELRRRLK